ncbi:MAG: NAD(P)/FAD-dependent oxidoreductase [Candidatus Peribacter sp.]|jgi:protoporphyrinogen oxidase|nr:NAD(P)/FAD-dependent oxidoreductase [Candidatus Peribacter sp.]MBT4393185.1 NAD(P)/FAD-dependent oxidoreductase [Candidatus Peribacter sp.]MBT4600471.1 NAD(P)/FAD-dependent oxidoreductase [Candidatus Peribacter sp.]MBT5148553.1 NAD(P)/FAD-dependent oxidoreductase [Candidatus Peribacter sp.]MBT5937800.1 NAD(P)/FAD-dependent oxidoreductase [Candidatus Peribacter sp.]
MSKIAIIAGAGPAGLTAAYELLNRTDIKPIVFEASDAIGGIAQTYNYKGNRIDIGGHRFFSKSKRVMDWWFNIMPVQGHPAADTEAKQHEIDYVVESVMEYLCSGEKKTVKAPDPEKEDNVMLHRPRVSRIYFKRNFFPYPIGITLHIAWRLGLINTTLIGFSYIKAQLFKRKDETYLDAFMINRFGMRLYKTFFEDYTKKVWGVPCSEIKADWGAQRIKGLSLRRAVAHAVKDLLSSDFSKQQEERETSLITRFFYPKFGPGQMWETVTRQVTQCGGQVHMNKRVESVKWKEESGKRKVTSVVIKDVQSGDTEEIACDYFFSTMPVKHLVAGMQPAAEESVQEVAKGLIYRDFMTVGLLLNKLHVEEKGKKPSTEVPDNWIYVQDRGVKVGRIQIFNNWSPYMVCDHTKNVWIGLEYFVDEGDELWEKKDEDMIAQGVAEMKEIGFIDPADVQDACVLRMQKAYPAYFGTYDKLDTIRDWSLTIPNLFLIGRNGMHRYNNQDHSMLTAMTAVDNIVAGETDNQNIWEVNAERVYHEEKK